MYLSAVIERGADALLPLLDTIHHRGPRAVFLAHNKGSYEIRNYPAAGRLAEKYLNDTSGLTITVGVYAYDTKHPLLQASHLYQDILEATPREQLNKLRTHP